MTQNIIKSSLRTVFPQHERDNLWQLIDKMMQSDLNSSQAIYVFNILYGIYQLIIRYETTCKEITLMAEMEDDSQKLRTNVCNLCKGALHDGLQIANRSLDKSAYISELSTGKEALH